MTDACNTLESFEQEALVNLDRAMLGGPDVPAVPGESVFDHMRRRQAAYRAQQAGDASGDTTEPDEATMMAVLCRAAEREEEGEPVPGGMTSAEMSAWLRQPADEIPESHAADVAVIRRITNTRDTD